MGAPVQHHTHTKRFHAPALSSSDPNLKMIMEHLQSKRTMTMVTLQNGASPNPSPASPSDLAQEIVKAKKPAEEPPAEPKPEAAPEPDAAEEEEEPEPTHSDLRISRKVEAEDKRKTSLDTYVDSDALGKILRENPSEELALFGKTVAQTPEGAGQQDPILNMLLGRHSSKMEAAAPRYGDHQDFEEIFMG